MLEVDNGQALIDDLWEVTSAKVQLTDPMRKSFFAPKGATPSFYDNKRTYHRYFMRGKAVLKRGKTLLGTYTKDVSRQGVGFLSPVQLLPKELVKLRLPTTELSLEVARCRRLEHGCFDCGARFALEPGLIRSTN
jgi:hypothetical protein